jgi:hypothetical protein
MSDSEQLQAEPQTKSAGEGAGGEQQQAPVSRRIARKADAGWADAFQGGGGATAGNAIAEKNKDAGSIADEGFSGPGMELPNRAHYERSFGANFANVEVYTDAAAQKACKDMNARAYTVGNKIAFADPSLVHNRALVSHELTHVSQHTGTGPASKSSGGSDGDGIDRSGEAEAEQVEAAVEGGKAARSALATGESEGETPAAGGTTSGKQGAARKQGPARDSPWGGALTMDAGQLKTKLSYQIAGTPVYVPIVAVPGLSMFFRPSISVQAQHGTSFQNDMTISLGVEGAVEGGLSYGAGPAAEIYGGINGAITGALEYKQQGPWWHLQGDIKMETFFSAGVRVAGGIFDFRTEFGKVEIGTLAGIRFTNQGLEAQLLHWRWGPTPTNFYQMASNAVNRAAAIASAPQRFVTSNVRSAMNWLRGR